MAPVWGIGFNVVTIWCGFAEKGGCERGHGCMGQRGGPARALLEDGPLLLRASCEAGLAKLPARRPG